MQFNGYKGGKIRIKRGSEKFRERDRKIEREKKKTSVTLRTKFS